MSTQDHMDDGVISSKDVEGTSVFSSSGSKLGSIDELMIDKASGQVRYAVMEFGGFLGVGTDRYPVPWSLLTYDIDKGGYVVPLDRAKLDGAPNHREGSVPRYDAAYEQHLNSYYGVTL